MQPSNLRRRWFIDRPIQGALLGRAIIYWAATLVIQIVLLIFLTMIISSPDDFYLNMGRLWTYLRLMVIAAALVLPLVLRDLVRLSHRWVGPILRLRTALNALSRGESISPIRFREGDYWQELAGDFNIVAAELTRLRAAAREDSAVADATAETASHS
jgi:hypothetical protein